MTKGHKQNSPAPFALLCILSQAFPISSAHGTEAKTAPTNAAQIINTDSSKGFQIEEIIISATRTGETELQTTALTMAVIGEAQIDRTAITDIRDLAQLVPSLNISENTGAAQIFIRGIGTNATFSGADPSSTVYADGVYIARPAASFANFIDIDRIEILKGPQGTLYGRNSVGGNINVITKRPSDEANFKAKATLGNYGFHRLEGYATGPLSQNLKASVSLYGSYRDGYQDNTAPNPATKDLHDENIEAIRAQILWDTTDELEFILRGNYFRWDQTINTFSKPLLENNLVGSALIDGQFDDFGKVAFNELNFYKRENYGGSLTANWKPSNELSVTSLTAYRRNDIEGNIDADASELPLVESQTTNTSYQISQEISMLIKQDNFTALFGGFYFDEKEDDDFTVNNKIIGVGLNFRPEVEVSSWAAFGQVDYRLTPAFTLTAGIRYTDDEKTLDQNFFTSSLAAGVTLSQIPGFERTINTREFTPKFGLEYQPNDELFFYATVSRGYKSGGFNSLTVAPNDGFEAEFLWAYEGGVKTRFLDDRLHLNFAGFYYDYKDLQVQAFIRPGVTDISNAATATVKGLEFEARAAPLKNLHLSFYGAYLNAKYDSYPAAQGPGNTIVDASGNRLNNSPEFSFSSNAEYEFRVTDQLNGFVRGEYNWQDRVYFTALNNDIETQRAYGLLNASIGIENKQQGWSIFIWGRNITDTDYIINSASFTAAGPSGTIGIPATYGLRLGLGF